MFQSELVREMRLLRKSVCQLIQVQRVENSNVIGMTSEFAAGHSNLVKESRKIRGCLTEFVCALLSVPIAKRELKIYSFVTTFFISERHH